MIKKIFSIFDKKSGLFSGLTLFVNHSEAVRSFQDAVGNSGSLFCSHPEDFDLYCLGEFNEGSGLIYCDSDTKELVISAVDLVSKKEVSSVNS